MTTECPMCRGTSSLAFQVGDLNRRASDNVFSCYRCPACSTVFLSPQPRDMARHYPANYHELPGSLGELAERVGPDRYKLTLLREYLPAGRLLEVGPAWGGFVYIAKGAGYEVEAVEMDEACSTFIANTLGATVYRSTDPVAAVAAVPPYDAILLWHVLEHLADPLRVLHGLTARLRHGGVLIIGTPNPEALQFRIFGPLWPHVDAPRHLVLMPVSILARQLASAGLELVATTTRDGGAARLDRFGWQQGLSNLSRNGRVRCALWTIGLGAYWLFRPWERREGRGAAYTAVFRKTGAAPAAPDDTGDSMGG